MHHTTTKSIPSIKKSSRIEILLKQVRSIYNREGFLGANRRLWLLATSGKILKTLKSGILDHNSYPEWICLYDTLTDKKRAVILDRINNFKHEPLISIIMPLYNLQNERLIEAIESVRNQLYSDWELCIAANASTDKTTHSILKKYENNDPRIKVFFHEQNSHISAVLNSALEMATGEWIAFLDHDDLLSEHALFWVTDAINQHSNIHLIYSDEDKINDAGERHDPYFKCDWNRDLFYSHNLIIHLAIYRAKLVNKVGRLQLDIEGAQDYALALRFLEHIKPEQIYHIPRVLYHWRVHTETTALLPDAKPYAMKLEEKALNEHFHRKNIKAAAEFIGHGCRVHYNLPDNLPLVSLIIPTRNGLHLIRQCIESILKKTSYSNYEILIIDNGSDDHETLRYLDRLGDTSNIRVINDERCPFNYSALNNNAVKLVQGEFIGLINNDIEVISSDWLSEMISHAQRPEVGAVGAMLYYPDNHIQHAGVILGMGGIAGHAYKRQPRGEYGYFGRAKLVQELSAVTAACLIIRKSAYLSVGGLNETDLPVAYNDIDFCLRLQEAGYKNIWTPYAELYHHESATRGYEDTPEKKARFAKEKDYMKKRWGDVLLNDPAYNPNLSLKHTDFRLAWPPRDEII